MPIPDLWPEDISHETDLVMPVTILREQAAALTQRTKGIIEAEVKSLKPQVNNDQIVHEFMLIAPSLDGYAHELFYVTHRMNGYPISVYFGENTYGQRQKETASDQKSFMDILRIIFSSASTKDVIQALIAQSKS